MAKLIGMLGRAWKGKRLEQEYFRRPSTSPDDGSPYIWQAAFHNAGAHYRERALICANQIGKTRSCSAEVAIHLTGMYPDWWKGKKYNRPVRARVGSETNEDSRNIAQAALLGEPGEYGTGWIPGSTIHRDGPNMRNCGIRDVIDTVRIKHKLGGWSLLQFKSYEQGVGKWRGDELDIVWLDEECDEDIHSEAKTRLLTRKGTLFHSFTPHLGQTELVMRYMQLGEKDRVYIKNATWKDAPHLSPKECADYLAEYPEHERETRSTGIPMMGQGAVFKWPDELIICDGFTIPNYYAEINGCDFGINHPQAGARLAHDRDNDCVYLVDEYKEQGQDAAHHVQRFNIWGQAIPVAWPHDGVNREKGTGEQLSEIYAESGANMLGLSARWLDDKGGGQSVERGVMELNDRAKTGRFKVFSHCTQFLEEKRFLHRKDGKIVAVRDDIFKSVLYGMMMLRYAVAKNETTLYSTVADADYDPLQDF